ncbi:MAG: PAS domain S-box protein [Candidatus Thermoplasmatota archaeon]|nr:PAS domain S-box protein [Candidatus Thermoplasmatota archaeon]
MKLLLVGEDIEYLNELEKSFNEEMSELVIDLADSVDEAIPLFKNNQYHGIITDHDRLGNGCIDLLEKIRRDEDSSVPFLILSSEMEDEPAVKALNLGADRYLLKKGDIGVNCSRLASAVVEEVEHRQNAERLVELNSLLMSIRNIDRLIFEEDDLSSLIERSCDVLLQTGGYLNVEIALLDDDEKIKPFSSSGEHDHWDWKLKKDGEGDAPECVKEAMNTRSTVTIKGMKHYCEVCDYPEDEIDHHTVLVPMTSEEELFGFLIVCHKPDRFISKREVELLEEVVDDLSLARRRLMAEQTLEEERDLFVEGSTVLFKWRAEENYPIEYVTPNVEEILGYEQEEMISGDISYADILPETDLARLKREVERHIDIEADRIEHRPYRLIKKDGGIIWVKDHTKIIRDEGEVKYYLGYLVDITEQKRAEESLQKSEERYRRLFESAKDGILILNYYTGEIKDANPYIRDILDYSLDELQEEELWEIGSFEQICENRDGFKELRDQDYVRYEDIPLHTKDGKKVPVEFVSNVYRAGGEEVIQCNIRELSERKKTEEKLEEQHRLLQNLLGNAPGVAFRCLFDEYYTMKFLSQGCKELTGYDQEDLIDNRESSYKELILPEDRKDLRDKIQRSIEEDERYKHTYRIKTADGDVKWVWERGKGVDTDNDHTYIEGMIIDITDRKEVERELKKSEERYRTIFQSANDAIMIMGRNKFLDCNEKTEEMFKCDREEIIGRAPWEFSPKKQPDGRPSKDKAREKIDQAFEGEATFFEWVHKKMDGTEFHTEVSLNRYDIGEESRLIAVVRDITDRKEAQKRKKFLHTMLGHDVGNKTQTAKGYLKLLKEKYGEEELIDKSIRAVNEAQDIIEKIEDLRKVEEQEKIRKMYVQPLIKNVIKKYEPHLEGIDIDLEAEEKFQVKAGPLLETLFSNLIENSVRHSDCDNIKIKILSKGDEVMILFEDDGIGIPDHKKEKIIEKGFKEGEKAGSGLGMYLSKEIVESYDGRLEVKDSELGGARFDVYLKRA